jgi:hypothetical protein
VGAARVSREDPLPGKAFDPFRLLHVLPWLVVAAAMRVVAFGGTPAAIPATIIATIAVMHAFVVTTRFAIESAGGRTQLGDIDFGEQLKLTLSILWRIVPLIFAVAVALQFLEFQTLASNVLLGIDGMAFDQFTSIGQFWSATVAALVLVMIVSAERSGGKVTFFKAVAELAWRWPWLGHAVLLRGIIYLGLGFAQGLIRDAIWQFWQTSEASQFTKNLVYFIFIFSFAMLRLWATLLTLTFALKRSYVQNQTPGASSANP